ncbi:MAG: hypothetical protein HYW07_14345 [Candidatus Latescibacteria bacterium]|nr:hypothetical protein [Candidatus Latescibacterota bacterium]
MASANEEGYKSPRHKLLRFFEQSRDQWKAKCLAAKAKLKGQQHRIRYLEESKAEWKARAQALEAEVAQLQRQVQAPDRPGLAGGGKKPVG